MIIEFTQNKSKYSKNVTLNEHHFLKKRTIVHFYVNIYFDVYVICEYMIRCIEQCYVLTQKY